MSFFDDTPACIIIDMAVRMDSSSVRLLMKCSKRLRHMLSINYIWRRYAEFLPNFMTAKHLESSVLEGFWNEWWKKNAKVKINIKYPQGSETRVGCLIEMRQRRNRAFFVVIDQKADPAFDEPTFNGYLVISQVLQSYAETEAQIAKDGFCITRPAHNRIIKICNGMIVSPYCSYVAKN